MPLHRQETRNVSNVKGSRGTTKVHAKIFLDLGPFKYIVKTSMFLPHFSMSNTTYTITNKYLLPLVLGEYSHPTKQYDFHIIKPFGYGLNPITPPKWKTSRGESAFVTTVRSTDISFLSQQTYSNYQDRNRLYRTNVPKSNIGGKADKEDFKDVNQIKLKCLRERSETRGRWKLTLNGYPP